LVKAMQGKPVKFLAIMANATAAEAAVTQQQLAMPIYVDNLGIMQKRYGQKISLQNIWQMRIVGPDGKIVANNMTKEVLEKALTKVEGKYLGQEYDAKLGTALEAFEWGQYGAGMKLLTPARKSTNKDLAASAKKLYEVVKTQGEEWKSDADSAAESDPVKAYDLYSRVATVFTGDELGKSAAEPLKKLVKDKAVSAELAARKSFSQYLTSAARMTPPQKAAAVKMLQDIAKRHSGTPTADKAAELIKDLE
jgi:hypothetical protein